MGGARADYRSIRACNESSKLLSLSLGREGGGEKHGEGGRARGARGGRRGGEIGGRRERDRVGEREEANESSE